MSYTPNQNQPSGTGQQYNYTSSATSGSYSSPFNTSTSYSNSQYTPQYTQSTAQYGQPSYLSTSQTNQSQPSYLSTSQTNQYGSYSSPSYSTSQYSSPTYQTTATIAQPEVTTQVKKVESVKSSAPPGHSNVTTQQSSYTTTPSTYQQSSYSSFQVPTSYGNYDYNTTPYQTNSYSSYSTPTTAFGSQISAGSSAHHGEQVKKAGAPGPSANTVNVSSNITTTTTTPVTTTTTITEKTTEAGTYTGKTYILDPSTFIYANSSGYSGSYGSTNYGNTSSYGTGYNSSYNPTPVVTTDVTVTEKIEKKLGGNEQVKKAGQPTHNPVQASTNYSSSYGTTTSSYGTPSSYDYLNSGSQISSYQAQTPSYQPYGSYSTQSYQPTSYQSTSYQSTTNYQPTTYTPTTTSYGQSGYDYAKFDTSLPTFNPGNIGLTAQVQTQVKPTQTQSQSYSSGGDHTSHKMEVKPITLSNGAVVLSKAFANDPNSLFNKKLSQLTASGQKFTDDEFPPNAESVTGGLTEEELNEAHGGEGDIAWSSLVWKRPDEFYGPGNYCIFEGQIEPDDIKQGMAGDCYFLSVVASLAEWPHRIERLFVNKEINKAGIYAVKICDMGEWIDFILDDFFPCRPDDGSLAFAKGNGKELWVLLLEKAWAKCYNSYANIEAGLTREALHDLTGAPTKFYSTEDMSEQDKEKLWADVLYGEKNDFAMNCGANDTLGGVDDAMENGLVASHAYSLLSAHEVTGSFGKERIVKLRNPWGQTEWNGDWGDSSSIWTEDLKRQLGIDEKDDGIFHMSYDDFLANFSDVEIAKVHDDYHYTSIKVDTNHKNANFFKVRVPKAGKYYFTVNQHSRRHHPHSEFRYSPVWLILAKIERNGEEVKHIEACFKDDREVFTEGDLQEGDYHVYVKVAWFDKTTRPFVLSAYGPEDVSFTKSSKSELPNFAEKVYIDKGRVSKKLESYADLGQSQCFRAVELTDEGYGFIFYQNKSQKVLNETINFNVLEGLKLCKPFRGKQYQIRVAPGEEKIVLLKADPDSETIRQSFSERSKFE